jgi:hypothetical protein
MARFNRRVCGVYGGATTKKYEKVDFVRMQTTTHEMLLLLRSSKRKNMLWKDVKAACWEMKKTSVLFILESIHFQNNQSITLRHDMVFQKGSQFILI